MDLRKVLMISVAALATTAFTASTASARYYHRAHRGYMAYDQYRPSGPASLRFQNGSGWNNGRIDHNQAGRPDHW